MSNSNKFPASKREPDVNLNRRDILLSGGSMLALRQR